MAGDWLKMRVDLGDDPAVVAMSGNLDCSEFEVVGLLHRTWSWADRHTTDGTAPGITRAWLDRYTRAGFAAALESVGWVGFSDAGIQFTNFERHNGQSAKTRAEATVRQRLSRKSRDEGVTGSPRTNIPRPIARAVLTRDAFQCVYCGEQSSQQEEAGKRPRLSIDHMIPESRGGACNMANLVTCCRACNNEKNDRTPTEFGLEPTFLQPGVLYASEADGMSHAPCDKSVTREEKRREEKKEQDQKQERSPSGSRLAADWEPTPADIAFAEQDAPGVDWRHEAAKFRDYWQSKAGKDARKTNWHQTWRNWLRNSKPARAGPAAGHSKQLSGVAAILGVNPHDLASQFASGSVVQVADRNLPGDFVPAEPRRLPGG